jgi:hypothetical protein
MIVVPIFFARIVVVRVARVEARVEAVNGWLAGTKSDGDDR